MSIKLFAKTEGPFRVRQATDTTVTVEQDRLPVRVSIDHVTRIPRGPGTGLSLLAGTSAPYEWIEPPCRYDTNALDAFVVDRLVAHRYTPTGLEYKVQWYSYTSADDTYKPVEGLPQAFIDCYWRAHRAQIRSVAQAKKGSLPASVPVETTRAPPAEGR